MINKKFTAIIPARSGSKGFLNKNIMLLNGLPLFSYSIRFAKKLSFVEDVLFLTDSKEYAKLAELEGASIPYLRSKLTSSDNSMEEDILIELYDKKILKENTDVLWLRPTHPLRDLEKFEKAYNIYGNSNFDSVCLVTPADPRIYKGNSGHLHPLLDFLERKSMWRRQDLEKAFKIYHGELFKLPSSYDPKFLGSKIGYVEMSSLCSFDIDDSHDLDYLNMRIKTGIYDRFIH